ncbi:hypothetical protein GCM10018962_91060 [Dactylosporangium matsuzakiense]|uniref:Uncharacterized protein n=1 Tax=Dactylosporangium matsuzakiense TaxID=53360 RepID=A0A9W6NRN3_9ACTN|nr:hypothetical protein GCM10017581_083630 [Dactylosporangium matsuzakiense]
MRVGPILAGGRWVTSLSCCAVRRADDLAVVRLLRGGGPGGSGSAGGSSGRLRPGRLRPGWLRVESAAVEPG